ncbi:MAG: ABC transporter permease subunit [Phycisphaerales bacterium]
MNRGLVAKALRETLATTLTIGVALLAAEMLLAYVLPTFGGDIADQLQRLPFLKNMIAALVGAEVRELSAELFQALPWVHPVPLALVWSHAIVTCTRVPTGEIERGTIDSFLTLPVSRWHVHRAEVLVALFGSFTLVAFAISGNLAGGSIAGFMPRLDRVGIVALNLLAMHITVAGAAAAIGSLGERRGRAIAWVAGIVLASLLLNFLAQFWQPAKHVAFLSLMNYLRPIDVMRTGLWPWRDLGVLFGLALVLWGLAGWRLSRRDLASL